MNLFGIFNGKNGQEITREQLDKALDELSDEDFDEIVKKARIQRKLKL